MILPETILIVCVECGSVFKTYFPERKVCNICLLKYCGIDIKDKSNVIDVPMTLWKDD